MYIAKFAMQDYIDNHPNCSPMEVAAACGVHYNTARRFFITNNISYKKAEFTNSDNSEFVDIQEFPNYKVNKFGVVVNKTTNTQLATRKNERGYIVCDLYHNNERKTVRVHIQVAKYFVPNPNNYSEVNHIDGDTSNPIWSNLEWTTHKGNMIHAAKNSLLPFQKLTEEDAKKICEILAEKKKGSIRTTLKEIAVQFNVSKGCIEKISQGKNWAHVSCLYDI